MTQLMVLAGPTAVGKGTLVRALRDKHPQVWLSVSATTRPPRPGEIHGEHYFFVTDDEFDRMIVDGELLEWATVHGIHRYGTPRGPVEERVESGIPCILEIDLQGARQIKHTMPEALFVFVTPPSWDELLRRLEERGTEDQAERERRLETAREELQAEEEFSHVLVNDDLDDAVAQLEELAGLIR